MPSLPQLNTLKILGILLLLIAVVGMAAPVFLYFHDRSSKSEIEEKEGSRYRFPKPRHEIRGFRFDGFSGEKRVITIEADRLRVEKQKVGFFRFGMMNVARIDNASIHIYGNGIGKREEVDSAFKDVFSKDALPALSAKQVASIELKPVCVALHDEKKVVSRISADYAAVNLTKRNVVFKGKVKVESGSRSLTTDRLSLLPNEALIKTDQHFALKTNENQEEGNKLIADIFLKRVKH